MPRKRARGTAKAAMMAKTVELDGQGLTQKEIAAKLGVSQPMIHYRLAEARKKYLATINAAMADKVAQKLGQYEEIRASAQRTYEEAWGAWERSQAGDVGEDGNEGPRKAGNPAFLSIMQATRDQIMATLKAERELLGLDEAVKIQAEVTEKKEWAVATLFQEVAAYREQTVKMINAKVSDVSEAQSKGDEA